jgi:hypothetical protein
MTRRLAIAVAVAAGAVSVAAAAQSQKVYRSGVDLVSLDVSVTMRNRPVAGLSAADFNVTDNRVRQKVLDVSVDALPIDVTLVADTARRLYGPAGGLVGPLQMPVANGVNQVRRALRPEDRIRIVTFDTQVDEGRGLVAAGEAGPFQPDAATRPARSAAALYDAIALALVTDPPPDRRQVTIVFTPGFDSNSFLTAAAVLDVARRTRTAVFVVRSVVNPYPINRPPEGAQLLPVPPEDPQVVPAGFFRDLVEITGGTVRTVEPWVVVRNDTELRSARQSLGRGVDAALLAALDEFRTSYVVRYAVEGVPQVGWHAVEVRVSRPGATVRARAGYVIR